MCVHHYVAVISNLQAPDMSWICHFTTVTKKSFFGLSQRAPEPMSPPGAGCHQRHSLFPGTWGSPGHPTSRPASHGWAAQDAAGIRKSLTALGQHSWCQGTVCTWTTAFCLLKTTPIIRSSNNLPGITAYRCQNPCKPLPRSDTRRVWSPWLHSG